MKKNFIGCSGFVYPEWKGKFYPADIAKAKWLDHYSSKFNTVELNGTFYRFPTAKSMKTFYEGTPDDFKFAVKAHKIITHTLRMKNAKDKVNEFMKVVEDGLGKKLGCVLFQMPPGYKYSEENLQQIFDAVPLRPSTVVEFRSDTWWNKKVYEAFQKNNITFCNSDYPGMPSEIVPTKPLFYMRFHGQPVLYKSEYNMVQLKNFVRKVPKDSKERNIYFNNTWFLGAITNAMSIREMID